MEKVNFYDSITLEKVQAYAIKLCHMTSQEVSDERKDATKLICNDLLPPIATWPKKYRSLFFKRPLGDGDSATIFWFLLGRRLYIECNIAVIL